MKHATTFSGTGIGIQKGIIYKVLFRARYSISYFSHSKSSIPYPQSACVVIFCSVYFSHYLPQSERARRSSFDRNRTVGKNGPQSESCGICLCTLYSTVLLKVGIYSQRIDPHRFTVLDWHRSGSVVKTKSKNLHSEQRMRQTENAGYDLIATRPKQNAYFWKVEFSTSVYDELVPRDSLK